jgi:hypothetical protein
MSWPEHPQTLGRILLCLLASSIMLFLALSCLPVVVLRNAMQRLLLALEQAFDCVGNWMGWDVDRMPLPKASDEPLPKFNSNE